MNKLNIDKDALLEKPKEEFVLPEKWFIKSTESTASIIYDWLNVYKQNKISYTGLSNADKISYVCFPAYNNEHQRRGDDSYTKITFDQFKKYVLNQEVKEEVKSMEEWSVGSYAVVIQGQFGIFQKGDSNDKVHPLIKGTIFTINSVRDKSITVKESKYWIYKENCKWFPTLQEAQKFSDELMGKSKTNLRVEDLIEGEIYIDASNIIFMYNDIIGDKNPSILDNKFFKDDATINIGLHSPFKIFNNPKWLKTCIKQDKFIPKEQLDEYNYDGSLIESMKIPEYVEFEDVIYKVKEWTPHNYCRLIRHTNDSYFRPLEPFKHLVKPSNKEAYEAQFKKDEKFKDGDWLVYIKHCGLSPSLPIKIGDVRQMTRGSFGTLTIYGIEDLSQYFRKALPHEIPVENSINQYPYTPEESIKLDFEIKWKEPRYIGGVDSITATGWGIYEQMKKQPIQSRKTPDLIDKFKVEVKIKRTKVKQIKL